ncbi:hypothetical protein I4U23_020013 [Adineta vaga]|nr:hypothetical protein I4U23_020013 [Adineta vaga]
MELVNNSVQTGRRRYVDNCVIIYLDIIIDQVNIIQLGQLGFSIESFTDQNEYINFITDLKDTKIICVITDQLIDQNIHFLNYSPLVTSIYIISANEQQHDSWSEKSEKIKCVSNTLLPIIETLTKDLQMIDRNSTPITVLTSVSSVEQTNTLNAMYMYCELLKETFLEMNHGELAKRTLVDYSKIQYTDNEVALRVIDDLTEII